MKAGNNRFYFAMVMLAVLAYSIFSCILLDSGFSYFLSAGFSGFFLLLESCLFVIAYYKTGKKILAPFLVFYMLFFLFSAGQLIVIAFSGADSEFLYIWKRDYGASVYKKTVMFTAVSVLLFQAGYFLSAGCRFLPAAWKFKIRIRADARLMAAAVYAVSFCAYFSILLMQKITASSYSDIYQQNYGRYYNLLYGISLFLIPAYLLIQHAQKERVKKAVDVFTGLLIVLCLMIGRRGSAMMLAVPVFYTMIKKLRIKKIRLRHAAAFVAGGYSLVNLLYTIAAVRTSGFDAGYFISQYAVNFVQLKSPQYLMIEMGSSVRNMIECIYGMESGRMQHKYGLTYLYSVVILLPGIFRGGWDHYAVSNGLTGLAGYITKISGASYGLGGSMQFEAFYNFSFAGVLVFVLFGFVIGKALDGSYFQNAEYNEGYRICLLSFLITFPRTCMQDNLKRVIYVCVIPFLLYYWAGGCKKDRMDGGA